MFVMLKLLVENDEVDDDEYQVEIDLERLMMMLILMNVDDDVQTNELLFDKDHRFSKLIHRPKRKTFSFNE